MTYNNPRCAPKFAALLALLGLSAAIPAQAGAIFGLDIYTSLFDSGATLASNVAQYSSLSDDAYGLMNSFGDPNASLTTAIPGSPGSPQTLGNDLNALLLTLQSAMSTASAGDNLMTGLTNISLVTNNGASGPETQGAGNAQMLDGITFSENAEIGVQFSVNGSVDLLGPEASYSQGVLMSLGNSQFQWSGDASNSNGGSSASVVGSGTENWLSTAVSNQTPNSITFTGYMNVIAGQDLQFELLQQIGCSLGAACDFSDPGQISFILPQGETFTSDSGVFLSDAPSATPEPATFALLGLGLLAIGALTPRLRRC